METPHFTALYQIIVFLCAIVCLWLVLPLLGEPERAQHYHVYGGKIIVVDGRRRPTTTMTDDDYNRRQPTSQARAMTSPRNSRMGGAPPLHASYEWAGLY